MIITRLSGGLGNQLFQYAYGRALSLRSNNPLKLDIEGLIRSAKGDTPRPYQLSHFAIHADIATPEEIAKLKYPFGIISKGWRYASVKFLRRFNVGFEPRTFSHFERIAKKGGNVYLYGFWQTERYFAEAADTLRADFTLKERLGAPAQTFADKIVAAKRDGIATVSLHVRRGDVARDAMKNPYYGITTPEYYSSALTAIAERLGPAASNMQIFVFSDGIKWTRQNISIPYPVAYVEGAGIADYEELFLMSLCDHNIIANSSFSWWGAWLNPNPAKIVIAPKRWIRKRQKQHIDICPSTWLRI